MAAGSPQAVYVATATAPLLRRMGEVMLRDGVRQGHLAAQTGISDSVVSLLLVNKYKFHTVSPLSQQQSSSIDLPSSCPPL